MQSFYINYKSSKIHYQRGAGGHRLLFCFHGYGETAASFDFLEEPLNGLFTMLVIEMPFHGDTVWKEGLDFEPAELRDIMQMILVHQALSPVKVQLLGYSMGGRIALSLLELMPEKIDKLLLIAPDGITMGAWYKFATQNWLGNGIFNFTMNNPAWFQGLMKLAHALRLVNPSIHKFAKSYVDDQQVRHDLYLRWTTMRHFRPSIDKIKKLILSRRIPVELLYGRFDRMIRYESGNAFVKGLDPLAQLSILPSGHQLLNRKHLDLIISLL
jgi:pimeloyl-ACP methyl ester carboxylesterase